MFIFILMNQYIVYVVSRCIQQYIMTTIRYLHSYILLHVVVESFLLSSNYINIMQKQDISQYDIQIIYIDHYILINILI